MTNKNIETILKFMSVSQSKCFIEGLQGSEGNYFIEVANNMSAIINNAPALYETEGQGEIVKPILHCFWGNIDIFITEIDKENNEHFGYTSIGQGFFEAGYVNLKYIFKEVPFLNLDFNFNPKTIAEYKLKYQG